MVCVIKKVRALLKFSKKCADQHSCDIFVLFFQGPVVRTLCLSETCIIERDPATYIIVSCFPLSDVSVIDLVSYALLHFD